MAKQKKFSKGLVAAVLSIVAFAASAAGFPTSKDAPKGSPWTVMGSHPFTGTVEKGCSLIGLTTAECAEYQAARAADTCQHMDVPNGVVLDKLLFTKDGENIVDSDKKVSLSSATTRRSRVCAVGGKAVISFDGCNNLALVDHWSPAPVAVEGKGVPRPYQPTALKGGCSLGKERLIAISVLESAAEGGACAKKHVKSPDGRLARPDGVTAEYDGNALDEDRLSRTCGAGLNKTFKPGTLNHGITVVVAEGDGQEYPIFQGAVRGTTITPSAEYASAVVNGLIRVPDAFTTGVVEIRFDDYTKLMSPTSYHLRERVEKLSRGCPPTRATAIERVAPPVATASQ